MNKNFLYITSIAVSSLLALSACSDETGVSDNNNTNEGKTAIDLNVGMAGAATRAITELPAPAKLSTLPTGTTLFMVMKSEVEGQADKWTMTKAVTGEADGSNKSPVSFSDAGTPRYWDDCGARDAIVSVYSICTPGGTPNAPTIGGKSQYAYTATPSTGAWSADANALTITNWTVGTNQAALTAATFADQDLCYSNNVSNNSTGDHCLKFNSETKKFDKGDLMFYHALTKVTVNMTAGDGFEAAGGKKAFVNHATATIHGFNTKGNFDIPTGVVSGMSEEATDITTFQTGTKEVDNAQVVTRSAIIMPGRTLAASDKILTVDGDGSTYNVTAAELVAAMPVSKVMQQGTEYIINVRISKTGIKVAAYVKAWDTVEAEQVEPIINVNISWGTTDGTAKDGDFSFYMSKTSNTTGYGIASGDAFANNSVVSKDGSAWTMSPQLYWQDHSTGYHFRGVWPQTVTVGDGAKVVTSGDNQVIAVNNAAYTERTYPSDLMIGIPSGEPVAGITATEGLVNLTFQYIMSQVEVNLSTTKDASQVRLTDATVEIVGGYTSGEVLLKDRTVNTIGSLGSYTLNATSTANQFLSAVVPQPLTYTTPGAETNLRFKITIKNSADPDDIDVYYADVEPILEKGKTTKVAPNGKWESGKHYVYNLKVSKTKINVTATLTDWIKVTADENVWF